MPSLNALRLEVDGLVGRLHYALRPIHLPRPDVLTKNIRSDFVRLAKLLKDVAASTHELLLVLDAEGRQFHRIYHEMPASVECQLQLDGCVRAKDPIDGRDKVVTGMLPAHESYDPLPAVVLELLTSDVYQEPPQPHPSLSPFEEAVQNVELSRDTLVKSRLQKKYVTTLCKHIHAAQRLLKPSITNIVEHLKRHRDTVPQQLLSVLYLRNFTQQRVPTGNPLFVDLAPPAESEASGDGSEDDET